MIILAYFVISAVSAFLAGMGVGGGTVFILFATNLLKIEQKTAQAMNLIMFFVSAMSATFFNLKNKKIDIDILKKIIIYILVGSIIGSYFAKKLTNLKKYFSVFVMIIGIYEIITSLIRIKKAKTSNNPKKKGE